MSRLIDETGNRYGRLVVIKRRGSGKSRSVKWLCRCDCGNEKIILGASLRYGATKSCGCLQKERVHEANSLSTGEASFNALIANMKRGAHKRDLEWSLTKDQVRTLTKQNCYYCGAKPQQEKRPRSSSSPYIYNGLDRVDNSKGYIIDNIVPCCGFCNRAKGSKTVKQFWEWISQVCRHSVEKSDGRGMD